jgi:hypothetical protein
MQQRSLKRDALAIPTGLVCTSDARQDTTFFAFFDNLMRYCGDFGESKLVTNSPFQMCMKALRIQAATFLGL